MKYTLHNGKWFYVVTLFLLLFNLGWGQQVIGNFPYMEGGFENQTVGSLGTTLSATSWSRQSQSGATSSIVNGSPRSGAKNASVTNVSSVSRGLQSPQDATAANGPQASTSYVIQYYVRNSSSVTSFQMGAVTTNGTTNPSTYPTAAPLSANANWTKQTLVVTTTSTAVNTCGIGIAGRSSTGSFDVDDFVIYAGSAVDNTAPNSAGTVSVSGATLSALNVSWGAASGGVDGGGYVVVRYSSNPNADNDPNQNGIYAVGNTITNGTGSLVGTVRYIGTGTSFTDNVGLTQGTQYWYKVYTVDKAFNYASESQATGTTLSSNSAPVASAVNITGTTNVGQTLTGTYTYSDADTDAQGTSTFKWYRADDASGTNGAAISGANSSSYILQAADVGKYIRFGVVPVAATGTSPGTEAFSSWQGPVIDPSAVTATLSTTAPLTEANLTNELLTINLTNTTFVDSVLSVNNFTLNNAPAGVTVNDVVYNTSTSAILSLAYNGTDFDTNVTNFSITVAGAELASGTNLTTSTLPITALVETLSVSTISDFGSKCLSTETTNTFTVSGTNLKAGNVSLAALTGFTYSLNGTNFTPTTTIATSGGTLAATTVYVKFIPTIAQSYNGNIVVSGVGAPSVNRSVTGTGINTSPTVTSPTSGSITTTSATLGGNITVLGCNNVTERGIYYSTTSGFADGDGTKVSETSASYPTGIFTINVSSLTLNTTYYYKAFATSASGTAYTSQGSFTTLKLEPTNHPTNFIATGVTTGAIVPTWTASVTGTQAPDGYLIKASTTTVVDPVDGTDPANSNNISGGTANKEVTPGTATSGTTFTGMSSGTMYNYKIYPYTNTGAAIDFKIADAPSFSHATLPTALTNLAASNLQANTASLSWTLGTHNAGNKVLVFVKQGSAITTGTPTVAPATYSASTVFGSGTAYQNDPAAFCVYKGDGTTVAISGLLANTTYHVVIYRAVEATNSNGTNSYSAVLTTSFSTLANPVTLPYAQNFETTTSEWVLDASGTNKWAIGAATNNGGTKALYISSDSGTTNNYSTTTAQTGTNASVRVDLTGVTAATLSFDWKSNGENLSGTIYDYGEVYINTGGSDVLISGAKEFNNTTTFATKSIDLSAYVGGIVTLKFRWVNDNLDGNQPPFAVDNVSIVPIGIPNFTTTAISNITYNSADTGGTITTDGGSAITARGVVYATTPSPTLTNSVVPSGSGNGSYTSNLTGLLSNTTYYVRAYVTNANGTYYANEISFTTAIIPAPVATAATNVNATSFTANWNAMPGAASYVLDVYTISQTAQEVLNQNFNTITGTGGNDGSWSGTIASNSLAASDLTNWTITAGYKANNCVKIGTGSTQGSLQTPALGLSGNAVLTFRAGAWSGDSTQLNLEITGGGSLEMSSVTMLNAAFNSFTVGITGGTANTKITFKGKQASNSRFFLDDVKVVNSAVETPITNSPFSVTAPTIFKDVTGLTPSTTYYYRVRAINGPTPSANSNEIQVTTRPDTTIWDGNAWSNGAPALDMNAIVNGALPMSTSLEAKSITVNSGGSVIVSTGKTLRVANEVNNATNDATKFIVESGASLIQNNAAAVNVGPITVKRNSYPLYLQDYTLWASPVANQNLRNFSPNTLYNRFYSYDTTIGTNGNWVQEINTTADMNTKTFGLAKGYLIRMPNNWTAFSDLQTPGTVYPGVFVGVPNSGNITYTLSNANTQYNLVGNPYPSPISVARFRNANPGIGGTFYFYRKRNAAQGSGYGTLSQAGFAGNVTVTNFDLIEVGQGFFVKANGVSTLNFTNAMRAEASASAVFLRSTSAQATTTLTNDNPVEMNRFWLNLVKDNEQVGQALIGYMEGATLGVDEDFDAKYFNDSALALTSIINNQEYIIQARPVPFVATDVVPLGFKTDVAGTYTFALGNKEGIFADASQHPIYLKDYSTNTVHDLNTGAYTFTAQPGVYNTRFEILYYDSALAQPSFGIDNSVNVYKQDKTLVIDAGSTKLEKIEIWDTLGRLVFAVRTNESKVEIKQPMLENQILLIKVTTENGSNNKKIQY